MLWKTPRTRSRCATNTEAAVVAATRTALSTEDVHQRMNVLTNLHGVAFPTASVLLHFAHWDRYPILDFRALWSLGVDEPPAAYTFEFWAAYTRECRSLAEAAGVSMRTLDRALWQYSKEHQPPGSAAPPPTTSAGSGLHGKVQDHSGSTIRPDVYTRLIGAARACTTLSYSALPGGRGHIGRYLDAIADHEAANGRPPLTAVVVQKATGLPGVGMAITLARVRYSKPNEDPLRAWRRALAEVCEYWQNSPGVRG